MIKSSELKIMKENLIIPKAGDYADTPKNESEFRIVDVWEDEFYKIPQFCMMVHKDHYEPLVAFIKALPEYQQFIDGATSPYRRSDVVVGSPSITQILYKEPGSDREWVIGYDDFPVAALRCNDHCYVEDSQNWTIEDKIVEK